jgi:hypothetical protein
MPGLDRPSLPRVGPYDELRRYEFIVRICAHMVSCSGIAVVLEVNVLAGARVEDAASL